MYPFVRPMDTFEAGAFDVCSKLPPKVRVTAVTGSPVTHNPLIGIDYYPLQE